MKPHQSPLYQPPYHQDARPGPGNAAPQMQAHGIHGRQLAGAEKPQDNSPSDMPPQLSATYFPSGGDDFQMPELLSPSPQRVMPEVPENMQQGLQRMELEAQSIRTERDSMGPSLNTRVGGYGQQYQQPKSGQPTTDYSPASGYTPSNYSPFHDSANNSPQFEKKPNPVPSFSPFPKVSGDHIPPSDEEKEAVLAESRDYVLHSNDPSMQIIWARDVLAYVEIAAESALREAEASRRPGDRDPQRPATPKIEHELRVDATNIVKFLADQGHPEAVFIRSKWLEFGKFGKRQDKKEAYAGYMTSAQKGFGRAEYRIGMLYENSNDIENALKHYKAGLSKKDSAASYRLGMISLLGQHGQYKDVTRGLELIRSAADSADEDAPQGAFVYGMVIARDLPDVNIPEDVLGYDVTVARQYIEKAAYLGFAKAQLKMGQAYELCQLGCEFNPALSLHYYGLAAKQGQPEACLGVSRWFLFGYENTFVKNEQLAFKYAQLAAKAKLPTGEFAMGYYCEIGIYVEKDLREARKWYELAAEHGNSDAVGRIQGLAQHQTLSKEDHETTTLTRIKSQHGSMRGKRPDRFKQQNKPMPTLAERDQPSPRPSPRPSPHGSPRSQPYDRAGSNMPEPSRPNNMLDTNRPGFSAHLAERPKSAAPYPVDEKPAPLNLGSRPHSTAPAPYPDDGPRARPPFSPQYNNKMGPTADRPNSSFGIRSHSPGRHGPPPGPAMRPSQSAGNLDIPAAGMDPGRGRPVSASAGSGYRQASPGPGPQDPRHRSAQYPSQQGGYDQRFSGGPGGPAPNNPAKNRLTKPNPNPQPVPQTPPAQFPMGNFGTSPTPPGQPGRDYGPRMSSRPSGAPGSPYSNRSSGSMSSPPMPGSFGPRADSIGSIPMGSIAATTSGPGGLPPSQRMSGGRPELKDRPGPTQNGPGRASAPPGQARPTTTSPVPSPQLPSSATMSSPPAAKPAAKPSKSGPSTFEEMGIPQVKQDNDCIIM